MSASYFGTTYWLDDYFGPYFQPEGTGGVIIGALSGSFAGSSVFTGTLDQDELRDPGTKGKPWLYEVPHREFPAEAAALAARKVAAVEKRRATMAAKKAARAALNEDEDEELIWLLVA